MLARAVSSFRQSFPPSLDLLGAFPKLVLVLNHCFGISISLMLNIRRFNMNGVIFHSSLILLVFTMINYGEEKYLGFTHDVFISFRGEDTRHKFIGHLRNSLCRKGVNTFDDDEDLSMGLGISPALSKAIEESNILIIVFSENYASSTWCLNELVKILECTKKNNKQLVFPIFYHVNPSDIRNQRNSFGEAMIMHEDRFGKGSEEVETWRKALSEATNLPGQHIISTEYEINFIEKIAEKVHKNLPPKPLHIGHNLVGLEHPIEKVKSLLDMKHHDKTVRMLGIYGLGGIGKTQLAKALYNNIVHRFQAASFLADVGEKSKKQNGLEDLQKTLLSEMLEKLETELGSTSKGMQEIKSKLCRKKVLLVLDDVDDKDTLEKLAGGRDWFGLGSRIVITTRDEGLLIDYQVEKIYQMKELDEKHSLELFCWNAFKQSYPKPGYKDVSLLAVDYAKCHPLALKVIGSDLATIREGKVDAWECVLEEYKGNAIAGIQDVLKISYDRLGDNAKNVFLDIACFFKGERIEYVKEILKDFCATLNINVLVNKSLLTIENGCLKMHDLIQDMGRDIVKKESLNPSERTRLWSYSDVIRVLTTNSGSEKIQGLMLDPPPEETPVNWNDRAFEKMKWLRILIVRNASFSTKPQHLPNHLRLLDWEEYQSNCFPRQFQPTDIIVFNLCKSHLTQAALFKKFSCLTIMNLSHSQSITELPDVGEVQNLRELRFDNCVNLIAVHKSVGFLKKLVHFSASKCTKLRTFLPQMFLPSLEVLDLSVCVNLEHFPDITGKMEKPLMIYMMHTSISELPDSIGNLIGLVYIEMQSSKKLRYVPSSLFMLPNVVTFKFGGCSQLGESLRSFLENHSNANGQSTLRTLNFRNAGLSDDDLRRIFFRFPMLEELIASRNNFECLPACIGKSKHLTNLNVSVCVKLRKIPECTNLRVLDIHHCWMLADISELPSTIQRVDARCCFSLTQETLAMLWRQVSKEIQGLEIVMPQTENIPEDTGLNFRGNGGNPQFWARGGGGGGGKFPVVALALVFQEVGKQSTQVQLRRQLVELHLVVNGQRVRRKGYYNFRIAGDHVLMCDLRLLFSSNEWQRLDEFLENDWNHVMVLYDAASNMNLGCWGAFVCEYEGGNVMSECPAPKYEISRISSMKRDRAQEQIKMIDKFGLDEMFDDDDNMDLVECDEERLHRYEISRQAKNVLESSRAGGECSTLGNNSDLVRFLETMNSEGEASRRGNWETSEAKKSTSSIKALLKKLEGIKSEIDALLHWKKQRNMEEFVDQVREMVRLNGLRDGMYGYLKLVEFQKNEKRGQLPSLISPHPSTSHDFTDWELYVS
ncbi:hypothetical protein RJT34_11029 [Clitoria ternatea]|uniref:TIR domain-containing protein n=1 Tax=Clitoria ternatea TaxID=43366 RepID=A0AAN9JJ98_CLITE